VGFILDARGFVTTPRVLDADSRGNMARQVTARIYTWLPITCVSGRDE
jgi:hypothetical protein